MTNAQPAPARRNSVTPPPARPGPSSIPYPLDADGDEPPSSDFAPSPRLHSHSDAFSDTSFPATPSRRGSGAASHRSTGGRTRTRPRSNRYLPNSLAAELADYGATLRALQWEGSHDLGVALGKRAEWEKWAGEEMMVKERGGGNGGQEADGRTSGAGENAASQPTGDGEGEARKDGAGQQSPTSLQTDAGHSKGKETDLDKDLDPSGRHASNHPYAPFAPALFHWPLLASEVPPPAWSLGEEIEALVERIWRGIDGDGSDAAATAIAFKEDDKGLRGRSLRKNSCSGKRRRSRSRSDSGSSTSSTRPESEADSSSDSGSNSDSDSGSGSGSSSDSSSSSRSTRKGKRRSEGSQARSPTSAPQRPVSPSDNLDLGDSFNDALAPLLDPALVSTQLQLSKILHLLGLAPPSKGSLGNQSARGSRRNSTTPSAQPRTRPVTRSSARANANARARSMSSIPSEAVSEASAPEEDAGETRGGDTTSNQLPIFARSTTRRLDWRDVMTVLASLAPGASPSLFSDTNACRAHSVLSNTRARLEGLYGTSLCQPARDYRATVQSVKVPDTQERMRILWNARGRLADFPLGLEDTARLVMSKIGTRAEDGDAHALGAGGEHQNRQRTVGPAPGTTTKRWPNTQANLTASLLSTTLLTLPFAPALALRPAPIEGRPETYPREIYAKRSHKRKVPPPGAAAGELGAVGSGNAGVAAGRNSAPPVVKRARRRKDASASATDGWSAQRGRTEGDGLETLGAQREEDVQDTTRARARDADESPRIALADMPASSPAPIQTQTQAQTRAHTLTRTRSRTRADEDANGAGGPARSSSLATHPLKVPSQTASARTDGHPNPNPNPSPTKARPSSRPNPKRTQQKAPANANAKEKPRQKQKQKQKQAQAPAQAQTETQPQVIKRRKAGF